MISGMGHVCLVFVCILLSCVVAFMYYFCIISLLGLYVYLLNIRNISIRTMYPSLFGSVLVSDWRCWLLVPKLWQATVGFFCYGLSVPRRLVFLLWFWCPIGVVGCWSSSYGRPMLVFSTMVCLCLGLDWL